jgi:hypothetical protein
MSKPITDTLRMLRRGAFVIEATDVLANTIRQVEETGKPGKVTITLDLKKAGGAIAVVAKVTDKTPEMAPDSDLLWATVDGDLTYQNPNQQSLDLEPVAGTVRKVVGEN